jgi:hypothetical protein
MINAWQHSIYKLHDLEAGRGEPGQSEQGLAQTNGFHTPRDTPFQRQPRLHVRSVAFAKRNPVLKVFGRSDYFRKRVLGFAITSPRQMSMSVSETPSRTHTQRYKLHCRLMSPGMATPQTSNNLTVTIRASNSGTDRLA